ncbi:hypothetical protein BDV10DRAFT_182790 [Aspergillus recurvatus]
MQVTLRILRLILRAMLDILPVQEILQARLVNCPLCPQPPITRLCSSTYLHSITPALFARELNDLLIASNYYSDNESVFVHACWDRFPYKRQTLAVKVSRHIHTPRWSASLASTVVHKILQLDCNQPLSAEERDALTAKLIDAMVYSRYGSQFLRNPKALKNQINGSIYWSTMEPYEEALRTALLTSAIVRNDVAELTCFLDQEPEAVHRGSRRFGVVPLDVIARVGSKEMIRALARRRYPLEYSCRLGPGSGDHTHMLRRAAQFRNKAALEGWMEGPNYAFGFGRITTDVQSELIKILGVAVERGDLDMANFLSRLFTGQDAFPRLLSRACEGGSAQMVQWCLGRDDARVYGSGRRKGPVWLALQDCYDAEKRPAVVNLLLQYGFDPNDLRLGLEESLLQWAVKIQDLESARLLVEHGADVNAHTDSVREYKVRYLSPLARAVDGPQGMVQMLLENGARRRWRWKGKEYVLETAAEGCRHVDRAFRDLGFGQGDIGDEGLQFYVVVNECKT